MTTPSYLTWDGESSSGTLPRRPSTDDLGGDQLIDDLEYPPDPREMPTAGGWNQRAKQLAAIEKVISSCKLEVRYTAGTPAIARATAPGTNVTAATFTVNDNGTGDVSITWPANTFPPHVISPSGLTILSSATTACVGQVEEITNGIRVRLFQGGSAADLNFTIHIN